MAESPPSIVMVDRVRKLALEYGLDLTDEETASIGRQSASFERLFHMLHEVDLSGGVFAHVRIAPMKKFPFFNQHWKFSASIEAGAVVQFACGATDN